MTKKTKTPTSSAKPTRGDKDGRVEHNTIHIKEWWHKWLVANVAVQSYGKN